LGVGELVVQQPPSEGERKGRNISSSESAIPRLVGRDKAAITLAECRHLSARWLKRGGTKDLQIAINPKGNAKRTAWSGLHQARDGCLRGCRGVFCTRASRPGVDRNQPDRDGPRAGAASLKKKKGGGEMSPRAGKRQRGLRV